MGQMYRYRRNFNGILEGVRNVSDTLQNNGMKFLLEDAKYGIHRLLKQRAAGLLVQLPHELREKSGGEK